MTSTAFVAWAVAHGWTVLAHGPAVVTARHRDGRTRTWEKQPGAWWRVTEKRGRRGGAKEEAGT